MEKNDLAFNEEKENLKDNLIKINSVINNFEIDYEKNEEEIHRQPSNDYEAGEYRRDLLYKNSNLYKNKKFYKEKKLNPYFGHLIFQSSEEDVDMYVGENSLVDENKNNIVYDWRAPLASMFYENQTHLNYKNTKYNLSLKRRVQISNSELVRCFESFCKKDGHTKIVDDFLIKLLESKRKSNEFIDIIRTIQSKQNEIIRFDNNKNMIVQGVAGSGKTAIIVHRLSYLLFNYPSTNPKQFLFIAPTNIFKNNLNDLNIKLQIDKIPILTMSEYYLANLKKLFDSETLSIEQIVNDNNQDNMHFRTKYLSNYTNTIIDYFENDYKNSVKSYSDLINMDYINKELKNNKIIDRYKAIKDSINILQNNENNKINDINLLVSNILDNLIEMFNKKIQSNLNSNEEMFLFDSNINVVNNIQRAIEKTSKKIKDFYTVLEFDYADLESKNNAVNNINNEINNIVNTLNSDFVSNNITIDIRVLDYKKISNDIAEEYDKTKKNLNKYTMAYDKLCDKITNMKFKFIRQKKYKEMLEKKEEIFNNIDKQKQKEEYLSKINEKILNSLSLKLIQLSNIKEEIKTINSKQINLVNFDKYYNLFITFVNKIIELNGYINIDKYSVKKICNILNIFESRIGNNVIMEKLDYYDKFQETVNTVNWSVLNSYNDIMNDINTKINSKYLLRKYNNYIEDTCDKDVNKTKLINGKKINRSDAYIILKIAVELGYIKSNNYRYIYIDEAQDYDNNEIKLIRDLENNPILNIYGDLEQKIFSNINDRSSWKELSEILGMSFSYFDLNENYRNTTNVVNYCNENLHTNMIPIGYEGEKVFVKELLNINDCISEYKKLDECIVITNNKEYLDFFKCNNVNSFSVYQVKGLEFRNVIVIEENNWTKNMKYVAYTRTLNNLIIFKSNS